MCHEFVDHGVDVGDGVEDGGGPGATQSSGHIPGDGQWTHRRGWISDWEFRWSCVAHSFGLGMPERGAALAA